jgi:hypothetical protein
LGTVTYKWLDGHKILIGSLKFLNTPGNGTFFIRKTIFSYNFEFMWIHGIYQGLGKVRLLYLKNKECNIFCEKVAANSSF